MSLTIRITGDLRRTRHVVRHATVAILILLAGYVIICHGFGAVASDMLAQSRMRQQSGERWMPVNIPGL
jgi:hypothetical protein